jgi:hypothetical protein
MPVPVVERNEPVEQDVSVGVYGGAVETEWGNPSVAPASAGNEGILGIDPPSLAGASGGVLEVIRSHLIPV